MESLSELSPSRYLTFTYPHPNPIDANPYTDPLHIAVLDSPLLPSTPLPETGAILVPPGREHDWIFSTSSGQVSLLLSNSSISRLILIGSTPSSILKPYVKVSVPDLKPLQESLLPLLTALCPKIAFQLSSLPQVPFLSFEDNAIHIIPKEIIAGSIVGEMIVEDVAIKQSDDIIEFRRRLRFKRMPNLIQTQVLLLGNLDSGSVQQVKQGSLVQPYLKPMVTGLFLISPSIMEKLKSTIKTKPKCLCIGVGGGALHTCLKSQLGFHVFGVEIDPIVLDIAKRHFEFKEDEFLNVHIGDGIQIMKKFASNFVYFDAIMIDLDSGDVVSGIKAPPLEFLEKDFILSVKSILYDNGVLIMNVIPPLDDLSFLNGIFYVFLEGGFKELYKIDVEDSENFVIFATVCHVKVSEIERESEFVQTLERVVGGKLIGRIRKIGDNEGI